MNAIALAVAGLAPRIFPTLGEAMEWVWCEEAESELSSDDDSADLKLETFTPGRDTFAKIGFCKFWSVPIHAKLKQLRDKCELKWL